MAGVAHSVVGKVRLGSGFDPNQLLCDLPFYTFQGFPSLQRQEVGLDDYRDFCSHGCSFHTL